MPKALQTAKPRILVGLSTPVTSQIDGFEAAACQNGLPFFGDLRLAGWAAALQNGYADKLIIVGGPEDIPSKDCPIEAHVAFGRSGAKISVPRGYAGCHHLVNEFGIPSELLGWRSSGRHANADIDALAEVMMEFGAAGEIILSTSHFHLPRAIMDAQHAGIDLPPAVPAEAFPLACDLAAGGDPVIHQAALASALGGGRLAILAASEICEMAQKLNLAPPLPGAIRGALQCQTSI